MSGGEWILAIAALVFLVGLAFSLFTRTGSGINPRPWSADRGDAADPGAESPEELSGHDEGANRPFGYGTR
jgi:hypothetical protein